MVVVDGGEKIVSRIIAVFQEKQILVKTAMKLVLKLARGSKSGRKP